MSSIRVTLHIDLSSANERQSQSKENGECRQEQCQDMLGTQDSLRDGPGPAGEDGEHCMVMKLHFLLQVFLPSIIFAL